MTIERRYTGAFDVYRPSRDFGRVQIDTVFYGQGSTVDEVRRGLIDHDGYDSNIIVVASGDIIPLTAGELESLCEDHEVRVFQSEQDEDRGLWQWRREDGEASDTGFESEEAAMRDAVAALEDIGDIEWENGEE